MPRRAVAFYLLAALLSMPGPTAAKRPAVVMTILIDDLGFADTQVHNPDTPTPHIGALAREGIVLEHLHSYLYCSPTRRSILSGRLPVHISGSQAGTWSNYLPLQMTLLPAKLQAAGYETHMVGKGHLGYLTTDHLPVNRGFDSHLGYLGGYENYEHGLAPTCDVPQLANLPKRASPWEHPYDPPGGWPPHANTSTGMDPCRHDMWEHLAGAAPEVLAELNYSTTAYAERVVGFIANKRAGTPLYVHLTWQAVHGPYVMPDVPAAQKLSLADDPSYGNFCPPSGRAPEPGRETLRCNFGSMLKVVDQGMGNITAALTAAGLWEDTLLIVQSDNGGIGPGNNHPLRGTKMTPWQGGTRILGFVSGGVVPASLRGTRNHATLHTADWYPTLCNLVGVDPTDNATVWGRVRPIDGLDVWPVLMAGRNSTGREYLPTTAFSIIWQDRWKLYTNAGPADWFPPARGPDMAIVHANKTAWPCVAPTNPFLPLGACAICSAAQPCLFDLANDPTERKNVAAQQPAIAAQLAAQLAQYQPYVNGSMAPAELEHYECLDPRNLSRPWPEQYPLHPWYGNFSGPLCRPT